jgi:hypothetical protein
MCSSRWQSSVYMRLAECGDECRCHHLRVGCDVGNEQVLRCVGWLRYVAL